MTFSIICLSPQEWRIDLPTNRQQIMSRAAARGHRVLFVETGDFLGRHLWRLIRHGRRQSLARRLFAVEEAEPGIGVVKAVNVLPWGHKYSVPNVVNCALTARRIRRQAKRLPQPTILWIYDPCTSHVLSRCDAAFPVYDCVDDYAEQAGPDSHRRALVRAGDKEVASGARLVFTTSKALFERLRGWNPRTYFVPNVGDYRHFMTAVDRETAADELGDLPRPILGFAGNMVRAKVDFDLLEALAIARPSSTLLLIGPERPESRAQLARLSELPNVRWLGPKPYNELPRYVAAFDVGLIPYVANRYTQSCFPLKVYEYLAAGKPVVASGLPELADMAPDVILADDLTAFLAAVDEAVQASDNGAIPRRMALAAQNTWEARTERLLGLIADELQA